MFTVNKLKGEFKVEVITEALCHWGTCPPPR